MISAATRQSADLRGGPGPVVLHRPRPPGRDLRADPVFRRLLAAGIGYAAGCSPAWQPAPCPMSRTEECGRYERATADAHALSAHPCCWPRSAWSATAAPARPAEARPIGRSCSATPGTPGASMVALTDPATGLPRTTYRSATAPVRACVHRPDQHRRLPLVHGRRPGPRHHRAHRGVRAVGRTLPDAVHAGPARPERHVLQLVRPAHRRGAAPSGRRTAARSPRSCPVWTTAGWPRRCWSSQGRCRSCAARRTRLLDRDELRLLLRPGRRHADGGPG